MRTADEPEVAADHLRRALIESRERWRDFGMLAAEIAFEVDAAGRLNFLAPHEVLGFAAEDLLGRRAADVFGGTDHAGPDPFLTGLKNGRVWARHADGSQLCLQFSSTPMRDACGEPIGARGVARDVTDQEMRQAEAAGAIRRDDVLNRIFDEIRKEVRAPKILSAMLALLVRAVGAEGAAVLDLSEVPEISGVLQTIGRSPETFVTALCDMLQPDDGPPQATVLDGFQIVSCQATTRFGHQAALAVWRSQESRAWDADDRQLISAVTALVRIVLEHEATQRELARQARTDSLTGLLNRRAFMEEARRRIDRLERDGLPGTLIFVDLDRLKLLNDRLGHEAGDAALILASTVLQRIVRPADLVARLGGDEFALWLDGFDELTAAERAEHLRLTFPRDAARITEGEDFELTMSIGIACRQAGAGEELDDVIQRADRAMYAVKRNGRGHWRVSQPEQSA